MPQYSQKVMEHFMNPRNVGEIPDADGIGEVGNPVCGDMMIFYIKVDSDGRTLKDIKFKTFGCGAAIAVSSIVSEMAKGKTIDEALKFTRDMIAEELGGLPPQKMHCSNLGVDALHKAIQDYLSKIQKQPIICKCPFCFADLPCAEKIFCNQCKIQIVKCPSCGKLVKHTEFCENCGSKL